MREAVEHLSENNRTAGLPRRFFRFLFSADRLRAVVCCLPVFALPALADISLNVTSSRASIYLGESFNLTVEVNGADRGLEAPDMSSMPPGDVQLLGQHSNSRSSITIINGHMTRETYQGRVFSYQVKPAREGSFHTGPIRVTASGQSCTHPGITVNVAGIEKQDTVIAAVTASSTSVLVEEPFTVTLSIAVAELPEPFAANNEPLHPKLLPQISADFLELRQDTPGLKGPDLNQVLNNLIDQTGRQPAFAINSYQTRDMGFGNLFDADPFRPRPIRFRLAPKRVTLNNKKYRQYTLSLDYTPTKEGEFTFGPLSFKGTVITDVTSDRQAVTKDVYTIGPAVTVRVIPPPDEGRPDWFTGSVGKDMKAAASFDTTVCKVGDPLTLTLDVTGAISISNLRTPILNLQPELAKDFHIYDDNATADTLPNGKRFKYRIRPTRDGTLEFPPIKLAYYDTVTRAYKTIATAPIPIQALATTQIAAAGDDNSASASNVLAGQPERPRPAGITWDGQGLRNEPLLPPLRRSLILLVAGPVLCLLTIFASSLAHAFSVLRTRRRRSGALRHALQALRRAAAPDVAAHAVRVYLADRLDVTGSSLTPDEAAALLRQRQIPDTLVARSRGLLAQLDETMYRPDASTPLPETLAALKRLLPELDAALGHPPQSKRSGGPSLPILLFFAALPCLLHAEDTARAFLWEQANTQAAAAVRPDDFLKAANTYNRLVADGVRNGPLFINLGNTLVMAGDGANAAAAFARAERYQGATPETRQGIAAALALKTGHAHADLPWSRTAFFWHYALPCTFRALVALCGWTLFWIGVFFRIRFRLRRSRTYLRNLSETCMLTGCLIAAVFAASTLMTLMHERHDDATWAARVFLSAAANDTEVAP